MIFIQASCRAGSIRFGIEGPSELREVNLQLLDAVQQQLHVPTEEARSVAERLLDCHLECPLGGEYDRGGPAGKEVWRSTLLPELVNAKTSIPPGSYQAPWLDWYRGGELHLTQMSDRLILIGQLDFQKIASGGSCWRR